MSNDGLEWHFFDTFLNRQGGDVGGINDALLTLMSIAFLPALPSIFLAARFRVSKMHGIFCHRSCKSN
jgi:hypothetical protein